MTNFLEIRYKFCVDLCSNPITLSAMHVVVKNRANDRPTGTSVNFFKLKPFRNNSILYAPACIAHIHCAYHNDLD